MNTSADNLTSGIGSVRSRPFVRTRSARLMQTMDLVGRWAAPVATVITLLVAAIAVPAFYQPENVHTLAISVAVLGIVAIGQTLVLLVNGLDLSVNAVLALGAVIVVQNESQSGLATFAAFLGACALAIAIGLGNGLLIAKRKVPPFIATFGMLVFISGARLAYTHGQASGTVPGWMRVLGAGDLAFIPWAAVIWLIIGLAISGVLVATRYGRWVYATGGNREAARYAGVPVDGVTIAAYVVSALLALVAGVLLSGYIGYVDQRLGADYNLNSIAAAIVGGTTFSGGRGNLLGTAAGVLLLSVLLNLVVVAGLPINWQYAVQGFVLIVATAIQGIRAHLLDL